MPIVGVSLVRVSREKGGGRAGPQSEVFQGQIPAPWLSTMTGSDDRELWATPVAGVPGECD